jgi:membrane protease YdiL (CAAX protease family)
LALLYPVAVVGLTILVAWLAGATQVTDPVWGKLGRNLALMALTGIPMLILTEEGFFRGWLWASLERVGRDRAATLLWSSLAFSLWHWTWALIDDGLALSGLHALVYLGNAAVMGVGWGLLRWISGSVVVASVSHAIWNGLAYTLFGAGPIEGALGIERSLLYDVETGLVGLTLNLLFTLALWTGWKRRLESGGPGATG